MLLFLAIHMPWHMIRGRFLNLQTEFWCHRLCQTLAIWFPSQEFSNLIYLATSNHTFLTIGQPMNKCAIVSKSFFHNGHLPSPCLNLAYRMSHVGTFPFKIHQKNNFALVGHFSFHIDFTHQSRSSQPFLVMRIL